MPRTVRVLLAFAAAAAACDAPNEGEAEFLDLASTEKAADFACSGATVCTGDTSANELLTSTYRVGAMTTTHATLGQTFTTTVDGTPTSVRLRIRKLRPYTPPEGATMRLHAEIRAASGPADRPESTGGVLSSGSIDLMTAPVSGEVSIPLSGSTRLVAATSYLLTLKTDTVDVDDGSIALFGIGVLSTVSYGPGVAVRQSIRRTSVAAGWVPTRERPAGAYDLALALSLQTNRAPVFSSGANLGSVAGLSAVSLPLGASDPDGTAVTCILTEGTLPEGLALSGCTIAGTPANPASATTNTFTVSASDGELTTAVAFSLTVTHANEPPTFSAPSNLGSFAGGGGVGTIGLGASDPEGATVTCSLASGALPAGLSLTGCTITGVASNPASNTTTTFTVSASDGVLSASKAFSLTVTHANVAPSFSAPSSLGTYASSTSVGTISLGASDPEGATVTCSLASGALPGGLALSSCAITGTTTAVVSSVTSNFSVTASDGSLSTTSSFSLTVSPIGTTTAPATSCMAIYNAGGASGAYYVSPSGNQTNKTYVWCEMSHGGGWMLVARLASTGGMAPWNFDLQPNNSYGTYAANLTTDQNYYLNWNAFPYSEFMFRTNNDALWLTTPKSSFASYYANALQTVNASSAGGPTSWRWYNRGPGANPEDPWVSLYDHVGTILYGEASYAGSSAYYGPKNNNGGLGVFVR